MGNRIPSASLGRSRRLHRIRGLQLRLLIGEHLLLDEHAVGLRGVLLLGHAHAFLMTQLVGVGEHAGLDLLCEAHELVLFEDAHGDVVRAAGRIAEGQGGAHHVCEVRDGDEQAHDGGQGVGVEHAEADEQENKPQTRLPRLNFVFVSTLAMLRSGMVLVDAPSGISPNRVFGALYCTRVLDAAIEVLSQKMITLGLNRSPTMSCSPGA